MGFLTFLSLTLIVVCQAASLQSITERFSKALQDDVIEIRATCLDFLKLYQKNTVKGITNENFGTLCLGGESLPDLITGVQNELHKIEVSKVLDEIIVESSCNSILQMFREIQHQLNDFSIQLRVSYLNFLLSVRIKSRTWRNDFANTVITAFSKNIQAFKSAKTLMRQAIRHSLLQKKLGPEGDILFKLIKRGILILQLVTMNFFPVQNGLPVTREVFLYAQMKLLERLKDYQMELPTILGHMRAIARMLYSHPTNLDQYKTHKKVIDKYLEKDLNDILPLLIRLTGDYLKARKVYSRDMTHNEKVFDELLIGPEAEVVIELVRQLALDSQLAIQVTTIRQLTKKMNKLYEKLEKFRLRIEANLGFLAGKIEFEEEYDISVELVDFSWTI